MTIKALADVISGGSANDQAPPIGLYRSGPKIEALLMDCNLDLRIGSGSRVPALVGFLRNLANEPDGTAALVRVVERVAHPGDYIADPAKGEAVVEHLNAHLAYDGAEVIFDGKLPRLRLSNGTGSVVSTITAKAAVLDFDTVTLELNRALDSAEKDPEDAVTAANSTLEAVCRSILVELDLPLPAKKDVEGLLRAIQDPLGLSPARSDLPSEVAGDIRQILGGLTTVAKGVGALRTHAGDAHGRERRFARIDARIARLAIHAASTIALFLLETWERKSKRALLRACG